MLAFAALAGVPANTVRSIELVFDITPMGALYVDEIGVAQPVNELALMANESDGIEEAAE